MARTKMSEEERRRRDRDRKRLQRGGARLDFPAPKDGKLHNQYFPEIAKKHPMIESEVVTKRQLAKMCNDAPEPRKPRQKKPTAPPKDAQPKLWE